MQRLDINKNGINGWYCTVHNLYNDILRVQCQYCNETRDASLERSAVLVEIRRSGIMADAEEKELHADFFMRWCQETTDEVTPLSDSELTEWIRKLEQIVLKGKTKLLKAKEIERGRKAKNKPWLVPSNDDIDVNESIKNVKKRQERMSRIDKTNQLLSNMLGVAGADAMIKKFSGETAPNRTIIDKQELIVATTTRTTNTQESLLNDLSISIVNGIDTRPIDDLTSAAITAGHIANKLLGKSQPEPTEAKPDEPFDWTKLTK